MIALRPLAPWLDVVARNPRCPRQKREVGGTDASRGARGRIKGCEPFTLVRRSMLRPLKRVHEFRDPIHEFIRLDRQRGRLLILSHSSGSGTFTSLRSLLWSTPAHPIIALS